MNTRIVTASDLKLKTAEILNMVAYGGTEAIVERYGEKLVKIVPIMLPNTKKDYKSLVSKYYGSMPDFPEVYKSRVNSKHSVSW